MGTPWNHDPLRIRHSGCLAYNFGLCVCTSGSGSIAGGGDCRQRTGSGGSFHRSPDHVTWPGWQRMGRRTRSKVSRTLASFRPLGHQPVHVYDFGSSRDSSDVLSFHLSPRVRGGGRESTSHAVNHHGVGLSFQSRILAERC